MLGSQTRQWFYEDLFSRGVIDANAVAYALDNAIAKLRNMGVLPYDRPDSFI